MTHPTLDAPRLPTPLDASVLWGAAGKDRRDLAGAHGLGALRATHHPTAWPSPDSLSFALAQASEGVPGHVAPGTAPTALVEISKGIAAVYWDRSAIVFRRTPKGALRAPSCAHGAPVDGAPWTTDLLGEVLATCWTPADTPPKTEQDWLAPMSPSDMVLPWCPAVTAPPALWARRKALLGMLLSLLHHVATERPDPSATPVTGAFLRDAFAGPWSVRRLSPQDGRGLITFDGFDMEAIRDRGYTQPMARGNIHWFIGALESLLPAVFPGRLGWQAHIGMQGHACWKMGPFFTHTRGTPAFPMPDVPSTQHARLARLQEARGWRLALEEGGIGPLLSAFLDMSDVVDF